MIKLALHFWLKVGRNAMRPVKFSCNDRTANPIKKSKGIMENKNKIAFGFYLMKQAYSTR